MMSKNSSIARIAHEIEPICLEVESRIAENSEHDAKTWARANSLRHARTLAGMLQHCASAQSRRLSVCNASGIGWGHQDFSMVSYLVSKAGFSVDWHVFDTEDNPALQKPAFNDMLGRYPSIHLHFTDFKKSELILNGSYDFVLFTEIAEHLDYSVLLRILSSIRSVVKQDGHLIITTPNLLSFWNRRNFLFGKGCGPFFGDGMANLNFGFFGHIMLYDVTRMCRILHDIGFTANDARTFTFAQSRYGFSLLHRCKAALIDYLCDHGFHIGTNIFIIARASEQRTEIPLVI